MSYAVPGDVEIELGRVASSVAETAQWQAWLDRVERAIERRFIAAGTTLAAEIALGSPTVEDVIDVEVAAVIRKIQSPMWGVTSVTRSLDDASVTTRNESGDESGDPLGLTDAEWLSLLPNGIGESDAFSTSPGFEPDYGSYNWPAFLP